MYTHCRIGIVHENGSVSSIVCQSYGYPSDVGKTLLGHYWDTEKVLDLINLGNICVLGENLDGNGLTDTKSTIAYHRDFGCGLVVRRNSDLEDFVMDENERWNYLYDCGEWYYLDKHGDCDEISLKLLTEDFVENH